MAKVTFGSIVSSVTGKLGPLVFTRTKTGPRVYAAPGPRLINTPALNAHKCIIAQANADYTALSPDLKKMWQTLAQQESAVTRFNRAECKNGRLFYLGWRIRCLHADADILPTLVPTSPIYYYRDPRIDLFGVSFGFEYNGFPSGAVAPFPWSAAWISWSPNGHAAAGKTWKKFWPVPGHTQFARGVNLDPHIYSLIGIPPEWYPQTTGYRDQLTPVKIRQYQIYSFGKIWMSADFDLWAPAHRFYFREPPRPMVFFNPTP
jgi:hypothetical protein